MSNKAELLLACQCQLGEGPLYHEIENKLYWIDILGKQLHGLKLKSQAHSVLELPDTPGTFGFSESGHMMIFLPDGLHKIEGDGTLSLISRPDDMDDTLRFNDGKVDPWGRFVVGTMEKDGVNNKGVTNGSLYLVHKDGWFENIGPKQFHIPNGMAWTENEKHFYHVDTTKKSVYRYEYDTMKRLINKVKIIDFTNEVGVPDGLTIDKEGMLWIAHWGGGRISHWHPQEGKKLGEVLVASKNVTSCTFGGTNYQTLFITTAAIGGDIENDLSGEGGLYQYQPRIGGRGDYKYK